MNVVQGALYFTFQVELNRVIRDNVFKIAMMDRLNGPCFLKKFAQSG